MIARKTSRSVGDARGIIFSGKTSSSFLTIRVGQRRFGRVARERLLFIKMAVRCPELGMAGGEEAAAEPEAEGTVGGWQATAARPSW
jgi:hypothetical protein